MHSIYSSHKLFFHPYAWQWSKQKKKTEVGWTKHFNFWQINRINHLFQAPQANEWIGKSFLVLTNEEVSNRLLNLVNGPETQHQQTGFCRLIKKLGETIGTQQKNEWLICLCGCLKILISPLKPISGSGFATRSDPLVTLRLMGE